MSAFEELPGHRLVAVIQRRRIKLHRSREAAEHFEHSVSWYTGRRYAFDQQPHPFARLSFASLNEREISEAVKRMAAARR